MNPDLVADVGNTRIKWGRCLPGAIRESASLSPEDPVAWAAQLDAWGMRQPSSCVVTGVHPRRRDVLAAWLSEQGHRVIVLDDSRQLPLSVLLEHPERVGVDRLLNAVAVNSRRPTGVPAIVVDAGSAVTVDWLDEQGAFRGGAILPGIRLMAKALHNYTALLPLVEIREGLPKLPGASTPAAMQAGIFWAVAGGIRSLVAELAARALHLPQTWVAGGDASLLLAALGADVIAWPEMTLEGIRLAAQGMP